MTRLHTTLAAIVMLGLALCGQCRAWLYDGGSILYTGLSVSDTSNIVWVTEPFVLPHDSWVTGFGAAVARSYGIPGMGFNVYLSDTLVNAPSHALASGTIAPAGPLYTYQYVYPKQWTRLDGGKMYFLTLAPNSNNFAGSVAWLWNPTVYYGMGTGDYGKTWANVALPLCVRIDGYVVPEPDGLMVGLAGLLGLSLLRRVRVSRRAADRA